MRYISAVLVVAFIFISVAGSDAFAGKDRDRPDSKALCYIGMPWPWFPKSCGCSDGDGAAEALNRSIEAFMDTGVLSTSEIEFELESAELKSGSQGLLDKIGAVLSNWPEAEVEIAGHTDDSGSEEFNQKLSEDRAESVRAYLLENFQKLEEDNLKTVGHGEKYPEASNDTAEGRRHNRRVEFRILNKRELRRKSR